MPAEGSLSSQNLFAARERLAGIFSLDQQQAALKMAACSMRYYVFSSILSGRTMGSDQILTALNDVDMPIPGGRLRLATLQLEVTDSEQLPSAFDMLQMTVDVLSRCVNMQRDPKRILAHLTDAQGDTVCIMPLLKDHVEPAYFVDYLERVNEQLQKEHSGWRFTACISEEFSEPDRIAPVYFETRRIHELLVDSHAVGSVWSAEQYQREWEPKTDQPEPVWWVEPMRQYVMAHYADPEINIAFLAQQFGISPAYVGRKFRESTGIGLLELIHRCRLTDLNKRLAAGESLKNAAALVGYTSLVTMQRARERYPVE